MFERYTERARRTIFFARYEASQLGGSYIETEHLLLGLLREDKALAIRFLKSSAKIEAIRKLIEQRRNPGAKVTTSVDMPLSHESKRVLAYAAEESVRMNHKHLDTEHLFLGLLREEKCFAADLLREQGVMLDPARGQVQESGASEHSSIAGLDRWLAESQARGMWTIMQGIGRTRTTYFAVYANDSPAENQDAAQLTPAQKLARARRRLRFITNRMERAIAGYEFEEARSWSEEEHREREDVRQLLARFKLEEPPEAAPLLWIEVLGNARFVDVQTRCDEYIAEGVGEIWLLEPGSKRAYTATRNEGLREFKGEILRIGNPPLEMELRKVFG